MKRNFLLRLTDNESKCLNSFLDFLNKKYKGRIDDNFIKNYTKYQFSYWNRLQTRHKNGYIPISWIYGKKAITRWEQDVDWLKFRQNSDFSISEKANVKLSFLTQIDTQEESHKQKYHNKNKGLAWCSYNTTLYNHKSTNCLTCIFKLQCKEMLKLNMPNVYKLRGYQQ
jgi:hypothetical protein